MLVGSTMRRTKRRYLTSSNAEQRPGADIFTSVAVAAKRFMPIKAMVGTEWRVWMVREVVI